MTNPSWIEPPPPQRGLGCFGKGCLILAVFLILLLIAGLVGLYWGMHSDSALGRGIFWLSRIHALANRPAAVVEFKASDSQIDTAREHWQRFEQAARAGQPAEIELTGEDLNTLIASNSELAGRVSASIEDNWLRLQVSLPVTKFIGRVGYYFNADIVMESAGPQSVEHPDLARIKVNNQPVPSDLLDWRFHSRSLRNYLSEYSEETQMGSIEVRDGKLILRSKRD